MEKDRLSQLNQAEAASVQYGTLVRGQLLRLLDESSIGPLPSQVEVFTPTPKLPAYEIEISVLHHAMFRSNY